VDRRIAPSVQIEAAIEAALLNGSGGPDQLSELGRLGAQLVLQRAVEEELERRGSIVVGHRDWTRLDMSKRVQPEAEGPDFVRPPESRQYTLTYRIGF
jgi:hypothetical protein